MPLSVFPPYGYVALGHLHKPQRMGQNIRYSGSLLQYSFDESENKQVILLSASNGEIRVIQEIALTSGKKLVRLEAANMEQALALLGRYPEHYIELTLHMTAPLTTQETQALRAANEGLVSLIVHTEGSESIPVVKRSSMSPKDLFAEYYRSVYGDLPTEDLTETFMTLLEET